MAEKIGRNDPCSCGSGKKYKNCCMQKQQSKPTGLSGRKFTAKVISSGGAAKNQQVSGEGELDKPAIDYGLLMERSFGEALHGSKDDKPPMPSNPSQYLVADEESK